MLPLGLGTAPLAGLYVAVDDDVAAATLERAWTLGVRLFDTAPLYGSGLAEQRLGRALRGRPRDAFVVSTKVGRLLRPGAPDPVFAGAPALAPVFDLSADGVRRSLEESLERLGLEHVDIALIHDPEGHMREGLAAVSELESTCAVGLGTNEVETALTFVRETSIAHLLLAGRYTLLDRSAEHELLPLCAERGVSVLAAGVYNSGILAGGSTFGYRPAPPELVARAHSLADRCAHYGVPLAAAALQFPLRHPAIAQVLVGARTAAEIEQNLAWLALEIPDELWEDATITDRPEI
jgi:D-threo-aldose 1-dehydrogenase